MTTEYRTEADSMGEMQVPADAYYGASTARALANFPISGQGIPAALVRALGLIKLAAAHVNAEKGVITAEQHDAIAKAAQEVADNKLDAHFVVDVFQTGSGTSSNMNTNEVVANRATEILGGAMGSKLVHPNDHVNAGQSSNDVFPTAVHLATYDATVTKLLPAMEYLHKALDKKATEFADVVKSGRTHLMDAVPITLGQEFSGYARQVELGIARVKDALVRVAELPIGGTAVGTGLNAPEGMTDGVIKQLRSLTGHDGLVEAVNHFEAQAARDAIVELSGELKVIAVSLTKIVNDLRWMGSGPRTGFMEIRLPEIQPGSSIMPAKVNPVIPESVSMVCAQVIGNDAAITIGGLQGHFELNVFIPVIARNILESITLLAASCTNMVDKMVDGIQANPERCTELVEKNLSTVTAMVPAVGYDLSAKMAKRALKEDRPLREVCYEDAGISKEEVDKLLDMKKMTEGGVL